MAEGLLRSRAGDRFEVFSAGTDPQGVNPEAVRAMGELGIDIAGHTSKHVDTFDLTQIGTVITVCDRAAETCPIVPDGPARIHWGFDDPAKAEGGLEERRGVFRRVRDEIDASIRNWLARGAPDR